MNVELRSLACACQLEFEDFIRSTEEFNSGSMPFLEVATLYLKKSSVFTEDDIETINRHDFYTNETNYKVCAFWINRKYTIESIDSLKSTITKEYTKDLEEKDIKNIYSYIQEIHKGGN